MKRFFTLFASFAVLCAICSCSKKSIPEQMNEFATNAELKYDSYSDADWEKSNEAFEKLITEYTNTENQYSEAEKEMAAQAMGRYHALLVKQGINKFKDYFRSIGSIIPGYLNGFASELGNGTGGLIESINSLLNTDGLEKSLDKLGSTLEDMFDVDSSDIDVDDDFDDYDDDDFDGDDY